MLTTGLSVIATGGSAWSGQLKTGLLNRLTNARPERTELLEFFGCGFDPHQNRVQVLACKNFPFIGFRLLIALCGDGLNLLPKVRNSHSGGCAPPIPSIGRST